MTQTTEQGSKMPWLNWIEGASIAGAVGGSVVAALTQQVLFASLPLSVAAALNFANRQRLQLAMENLAATSAATEQLLMLQINNAQNLASEQIEALKATGAAMDQILMIQVNKIYNTTREGLGDLEAQVKDLQDKSESLMDHQLEILASTAEENAYRRGVEHDKRGEFKAAIAAFGEALKINETYGEAYMGRGLVYAQTAQKQLAIADLRTAAKLFFESGDLDKYHQARELSEQIHHADTAQRHSEPSDDLEVRLAVDELFV